MGTIDNLSNEMRDVLQSNILPYWENKILDTEHFGFFGQITGSGKVNSGADRGSTLAARIMWTYASAYRMFKDEKYLAMATFAMRYILDYFYDNKFGGVYWSLDYEGKPSETKKQIYSQSFAIFGLSEYYRATGIKETLDYAIRIYYLVEQHSFDFVKNGYREALSREWEQLDDVRLSEKDENEVKTMNTHLHLMEAYISLYRVWKDNGLKRQLTNLVDLFLTKIYNKNNNHFGLFFDEDWNCKSLTVAYGLEISALWMMYEAAEILSDKNLLQRVKEMVPIVLNSVSEGLEPDGSMIYEYDLATGLTDKDRHWWVEAETVMGFMYFYQKYQNEEMLDRALHCWTYIKANLIDRENGEWYWSILADGTVNVTDDKAGFWKCPYHDGRMCMEIIERFS